MKERKKSDKKEKMNKYERKIKRSYVKEQINQK